MGKKITNWTLSELEAMKEFSELDIYYELLDLLVQMEPYAERATLGKKASKKVVARESQNIKFLAQMLRDQTTEYSKGEVPNALVKRIEREQNKRDNAEAIHQSRIDNINKGRKENPDKRVTNLRAAMEEMKQKHEERKKAKEQSEASGTDTEIKD